VLFFICLFAAVVPTLGFLWLVWWLDRYEREPIRLVLATFCWGATGAVALALPASILLMSLLGQPFDSVSPINAVIVAPLIEESAKALVFVWLIRSRHFDNATDGFVYGAASGLGFAMSENLGYFLTYADAPALEFASIIAVRTLYSALMHACASSLIGAAIGHVRFRRRGQRMVALAIGATLALCVHALWNGLLVLGADGNPSPYAFINLILFPIEFAVVFVVFQMSLSLEQRSMRRELSAEAALGTIPTDHVAVLTSYRRRSRSGWEPAQVDRERYIAVTSLLAMRLHQLRYATEEWRTLYTDEVATLRAEVARLLETQNDDLS